MDEKRSIGWVVGTEAYDCEVEPGACPFCFADGTVVALPKPLLEKQPDATTHVCHPGLGGCNQGFEDTRRTREVSR